MIEKISCFMTDVIRLTLSSCDYRYCNEQCFDYIMAVLNECPNVFDNQVYLELWNTLFKICSNTIDESTILYLDK